MNMMTETEIQIITQFSLSFTQFSVRAGDPIEDGVLVIIAFQLNGRWQRL